MEQGAVLGWCVAGQIVDSCMTCAAKRLGRVACHRKCLLSCGFDRMQNEARQAEVEGVLGKQKEVIRQTLTKRDQALRCALQLSGCQVNACSSRACAACHPGAVCSPPIFLRL